MATLFQKADFCTMVEEARPRDKHLRALMAACRKPLTKADDPRLMAELHKL